MVDRTIYRDNALIGLKDHVGDESVYSVEVWQTGGVSTSGSLDVIKDIQDGAGDSIMDATNNAIRVNLVAGGAAGGTSMTDDAAFTPAATAINPIGAFCDETAPDSVDEGDAGAVRMSTNRNLYVTLRDAAGNERGLNVDANNKIGVDINGDYAEDSPHGSEDVGLFVLGVRNDSGSVMSGTSGDYTPFMVNSEGRLYTTTTGSVDVTSVPAPLNVVGGGAEATALRVTIANDSTGLLSVDDNGSSLTVDGTVAVSSGSIAITAIATGSTIIGKVGIDQTTPGTTNKVDASGAVPVVTNATGSAAIATSYAPAAAFWLDNITLHLSSSGSTSENFTITLNANDGAAYDTLLYSLDLSLASVTDLVYTPDNSPLLCEAGDSIDISWANSEARTYGLRIVAQLA